MLLLLAVLALVGVSCGRDRRQSVSVAVAANFTEPAKAIAESFRNETGSEAVLSFGSTGQLYAQISQDAPFQVFLAADDEAPRKAVDEGFADGGTLTTYAIGRIVLYSPGLDLSGGEAVLREGRFEKIALANPDTAPYGKAALETLKALGLDDRFGARIVRGNNIAQTFQFVDSGNAEIGFVAQSQVIGKPPSSIWVVPQALYSPIRQDAVLTARGASSDEARAFLEFLKGPEARTIVSSYGYGLAE